MATASEQSTASTTEFDSSANNMAEPATGLPTSTMATSSDTHAHVQPENANENESRRVETVADVEPPVMLTYFDIRIHANMSRSPLYGMTTALGLAMFVLLILGQIPRPGTCYGGAPWHQCAVLPVACVMMGAQAMFYARFGGGAYAPAPASKLGVVFFVAVHVLPGLAMLAMAAGIDVRGISPRSTILWSGIMHGYVIVSLIVARWHEGGRNMLCLQVTDPFRHGSLIRHYDDPTDEIQAALHRNWFQRALYGTCGPALGRLMLRKCQIIHASWYLHTRARVDFEYMGFALMMDPEDDSELDLDVQRSYWRAVKLECDMKRRGAALRSLILEHGLHPDLPALLGDATTREILDGIYSRFDPFEPRKRKDLVSDITRLLHENVKLLDQLRS